MTIEILDNKAGGWGCTLSPVCYVKEWILTSEFLSVTGPWQVGSVAT